MQAIEPVSQLRAVVHLPGSKSYSQRALVIAALAEGESRLENVLIAEDTRYLMEALRLLGAPISGGGSDLIVQGTGGRIQNPGRELSLGNNGTALRLMTSFVCLGAGRFVLTGTSRLRERPVQPLLEALSSMGVQASSQGGNGCPPVVIDADGIPGGKITLVNIESSQYVSSLMISAPYAAKDVKIVLEGRTVSRPYIDLTREVMGRFGISVGVQGDNTYQVQCGQRYRGREYRVEGDVSSASYFFLAAALCRGTVRVVNINPHSRQGDIRILEIMARFGCSVEQGDDWVEVTGGPLRPGEYIANMGDMPDMVPTVAVLAAFRPGRTVITNVAHLRLKESNRIEALVTELTRMGVSAEEQEDGLSITGGQPHGAEIETYRDHRIAMSFAVAGLAVPGVRIKDPRCVDKSFPGFWEEMAKLQETSGACHFGRGASGQGTGMKVILVGYRGTGKSSVGRMLAGRLGVPFYDTDHLIEERVGRSIRQMVTEKGWSFFREREKEIIGEVTAGGGAVIATGGGAVLDRDNRESLRKTGTCIWLTADAATILRRMNADDATGDQRPPLSDRDAVQEVVAGLGEREPLYRELADLSIDTTAGDIGAIVGRILRFLEEERCQAIP